MLIVTSPQVALCIEDPDVRRLVQTRFHQITNGDPYDVDVHGELVVVEPRDTVADVEHESGWPLLVNPFDGTRFGDPDYQPGIEALIDHPKVFEAVLLFSDSGAGEILFIPKQPGVDAELLAMCAAHSTPAGP